MSSDITRRAAYFEVLAAPAPLHDNQPNQGSKSITRGFAPRSSGMALVPESSLSLGAVAWTNQEGVVHDATLAGRAVCAKVGDPLLFLLSCSHP